MQLSGLQDQQHGLHQSMPCAAGALKHVNSSSTRKNKLQKQQQKQGGCLHEFTISFISGGHCLHAPTLLHVQLGQNTVGVAIMLWREQQPNDLVAGQVADFLHSADDFL